MSPTCDETLPVVLNPLGVSVRRTTRQAIIWKHEIRDHPPNRVFSKEEAMDYRSVRTNTSIPLPVAILAQFLTKVIKQVCCSVYVARRTSCLPTDRSRQETIVIHRSWPRTKHTSHDTSAGSRKRSLDYRM